MTKFLRRLTHRFSRLGKGRKKLQKWRKPTGRHNKMRKKRRSYAATVSIGYGSAKNSKGKIQNKTPKIIYNIKEMEKVGKDEIAIIGKVGKKNKIELLKKAREMKVQVYGINPEKFVKKMEKKIKPAKIAENKK
jgi:large subunit ribosomal protein L32e